MTTDKILTSEQQQWIDHCLQLPDDQITWVLSENKFALKDLSTGRLITPFIYDSCCQYLKRLPFKNRQGMIFVRIGKEWTAINKAGQTVIKFPYTDIEWGKELQAVKLRGNWGYINNAGEEVIPCIYDEAGCFDDGVAYVYKDGKFFFIDMIGNQATPFVYEYIYHKSRYGLRFVTRAGKCGFVNSVGKEIVPCIYEKASLFSEGTAVVVLNGRTGLIDDTGKEILPCIYDSTKDFEDIIGITMKDEYSNEEE